MSTSANTATAGRRQCWLGAALVSCAVLLLLAGCEPEDEGRAGGKDGRKDERPPVAPAARTGSASQAVPAGSVRITVDRYELETTDREPYELLATARDPSFQGGSSGLFDADGVQILGLKEDVATVLAARKSRGPSYDQRRECLVLAPGAEAKAEVVRFREHPATIAIRQKGALVDTIKESAASTALTVRVVAVTPQGVELDLLPLIGREDMWPPVKIRTLRTRVFVAPGRPVVIMADRAKRSDFSNAFFSTRKEDRSSEIIVALTVEPSAVAQK